jgi:hypothetical protein
MPRGDRTGPAGMGPMTGRAAGFCAGYSSPGYMNPVAGGGMGYYGRGFGRGRGMGGWGYRNMYYATGLPGWARYPFFPMGAAGVSPQAAPGMTREGEIELLNQQSEYLSNALKDVKKRLDELEAESEK